MTQPWIHKPKTDSIFILAPSFIVLIIVFLFHNKLLQIEKNYSFYVWLIFIVGIDVAHVYATLFKTYFVKETFKESKKLLISLPIICFIIGLILFSFGTLVFWSFLAYVAVFHFIRQQYGFMRLYSRNEIKTKFNVFLDNLIIYNATVFPMLFWFLSKNRKFNWFVENEFFLFENLNLIQYLYYLYFIIIGVYVVKTAYIYFNTKEFNIPKNSLIIGTYLSWYFGIVFYNNDLIFTLLNVVSHGIPYLALVYFKEVNNTRITLLKGFSTKSKVAVFVGFLLAIAFIEEFFWEIFVWQENFNFNFEVSENWQLILVPLLTVPQFTHYLLDGFIWKTKK